MKRKGWFSIPGLQDGDRTLEDQVRAVRPAIAECKGRTVLDLGCAEGLISLEFAKAGAKSVHGIDSILGNVNTAWQVCKGWPVTFETADLNLYIKDEFKRDLMPQYDIVLALGVTHKLHDPADGVVFAARIAKDLVLFRSGRAARDGVITNKWNSKVAVNAHKLMAMNGWRLDRVVKGPPPHSEDVEYWRPALPAAA